MKFSKTPIYKLYVQQQVSRPKAQGKDECFISWFLFLKMFLISSNLKNVYFKKRKMYKNIYINLEYIDISFTLLLKHIIKLHFQDFITPFSLETAQILAGPKGTV